jgi:hypothetical protein
MPEDRSTPIQGLAERQQFPGCKSGATAQVEHLLEVGPVPGHKLRHPARGIVLKRLEQFAVELGSELIKIAFDIFRGSGRHGPPEDGVEQITPDWIVRLLGKPHPANFGGRFEVTGGAENGKGISHDDIEILTILACNLAVVLKGFLDAAFDHGLKRQSPRPLLPGWRIERQGQSSGFVERSRATREIGCDEGQVAESEMSQAVDGVKINRHPHGSQGLCIALAPEQQQAKPEMGSGGFRIQSDRAAVGAFGRLNVVQPVCHTGEGLPGLSAVRIDFQRLPYRRQRLLVAIRSAVDACQIAPEVRIFRPERECGFKRPSGCVEPSILPMNETELSQGGGRMPELIDDAAEVRQVRL